MFNAIDSFVMWDDIISAECSPAVEATLKLGVSLLKGGNDKVQKVCVCIVIII